MNRPDEIEAAYSEAMRQYDILAEGWPDDCTMPLDASPMEFTTALDALRDAAEREVVETAEHAEAFAIITAAFHPDDFAQNPDDEDKLIAYIWKLRAEVKP